MGAISPVAELVTLADVKTHLRLGLSSREDAYLVILTAAAVRAIENATGRDVASELPDMPERDRAVAAQAALLLIGQWYANREVAGQNLTEMPMAITWLIAPLRKFVV
jgi:hypothetical protein